MGKETQGSVFTWVDGTETCSCSSQDSEEWMGRVIFGIEQENVISSLALRNCVTAPGLPHKETTSLSTVVIVYIGILDG